MHNIEGPDHKTELFTSHTADAAYAVDLITRMAKAIDSAMLKRSEEDLGYRDDEDIRHLLGQELWDEMCHAIGWDIDWDAVANGRS